MFQRSDAATAVAVIDRRSVGEEGLLVEEGGGSC